MVINTKNEHALLALICVAIGAMTGSASAITVEVAKRCDALTAKAYPPRQPGNPAAGSAKGTAQSQRAYFSKCVANGGNMVDHTDTEAK
jgi:hypothetical protein